QLQTYDVLFFFFFQAEDGIRDRNVTGVQTCALPISVVFKSGLLLSPEANKSPTLLRSIYDTEIPTSPADTPVPGVSSTVPSGETSTQSTSRDTFDMKT